jgi:hypothetical protein
MPMTTSIEEFVKKVKHTSSKWIIPKDVIESYFLETVEVDKGMKNYTEFRKKIYNDQNYIKWSTNYCKIHNIKPRKSKHTTEKVLLCGDSWWNWKIGNKYDKNNITMDRHKFLCESLRYVYILYSRHKKRDSVKTKFPRKKII